MFVSAQRPTPPPPPPFSSVVPHARLTENGPLTEGREFLWTDADFKRIKDLIHQKAGISLAEGKHAMVYSRISRRLRETGHTSFKSYLDGLAHHDGAEWQQFINALTTNLTAFFREQHHFTILSEHLSKERSKKWRIWCSAASTGEEPYSLAMTATEALGPSGAFSIDSSDIDTNVLATAARGVYKTDGVKGLTPAHLQRFFMRGKGENTGLMRVKPELQKSMAFEPVNLIENLPYRDPFDVVFCRNVMIYFDTETQRQVLERIHRVMKPGGLLFVGHAENFSEARSLFRLQGKTVYERI